MVLAFSPDAAKLAGVVVPHEAEREQVPGKALQIWDVKTGREIRSIPGTFVRVQRPAFSPDGKRIAAAVLAEGSSTERDIKVWELDGGREALSFSMPLAVEKSPILIDFSPDGGALATVSRRPTGDELQIWDLKTRRSRFAIPLQSTSRVSHAAFSPDGRRVACALNRLQVGVWDAADGRQLALYQGHQERVSAVAFGRDGRNLLASDDWSTIKIWDTSERSNSLILPYDGTVDSSAVNPDARRIATVVQAEDSSVCIDLRDATGRPLLSVKISTTRKKNQAPLNYDLVWNARGDRLVCARPAPWDRETTGAVLVSGTWPARNC